MNRHACSIVILSLASCLASANTTVIQAPRAAPQAALEAPKDLSANIGQCYTLDAAARHECIYAALVRSRKSKSDTVN